MASGSRLGGESTPGRKYTICPDLCLSGWLGIPTLLHLNTILTAVPAVQHLYTIQDRIRLFMQENKHMYTKGTRIYIIHTGDIHNKYTTICTISYTYIRKGGKV